MKRRRLGKLAHGIDFTKNKDARVTAIRFFSTEESIIVPYI